MCFFSCSELDLHPQAYVEPCARGLIRMRKQKQTDAYFLGTDYLLYKFHGREGEVVVASKVRKRPHLLR